MFKTDDTVLYSTQGVCKITDITEKKIYGETVKYYVLKPFHHQESVLFVPTENEKLTSKMRRVLSADEIYEIIDNMPNEDMEWISDENLRKQKYRDIIFSGDRRELVKIIKALYSHQKEQAARGKKLHQCDEKMLKEAEKMMYDEFAFALKIEPDQVLSFICDRIEKNKK